MDSRDRERAERPFSGGNLREVVTRWRERAKGVTAPTVVLKPVLKYLNKGVRGWMGSIMFGGNRAAMKWSARAAAVTAVLVAAGLSGSPAQAYGNSKFPVMFNNSTYYVYGSSYVASNNYVQAYTQTTGSLCWTNTKRLRVSIRTQSGGTASASGLLTQCKVTTSVFQGTGWWGTATHTFESIRSSSTISFTQ